MSLVKDDGSAAGWPDAVAIQLIPMDSTHANDGTPKSNAFTAERMQRFLADNRIGAQ